jgi:cell division protein FtsB
MSGRAGVLTVRALVLTLALGMFVATVAMPIRNWFGQRAEIATLQAEVEATKARVADLLVERERWNDPAFIAAESRRRLHFVFPGEIGYVALGADGRPAEETLMESAQIPIPWYATIGESLRAADSEDAPS